MGSEKRIDTERWTNERGLQRGDLILLETHSRIELISLGYFDAVKYPVLNKTPKVYLLEPRGIFRLSRLGDVWIPALLEEVAYSGQDAYGALVDSYLRVTKGPMSIADRLVEINKAFRIYSSLIKKMRPNKFLKQS
jgi:hypothetical protein